MEVEEGSAELASNSSLLREQIAEGKRVEIVMRETTERSVVGRSRGLHHPHLRRSSRHWWPL